MKLFSNSWALAWKLARLGWKHKKSISMSQINNLKKDLKAYEGTYAKYKKGEASCLATTISFRTQAFCEACSSNETIAQRFTTYRELSLQDCNTILGSCSNSWQTIFKIKSIAYTYNAVQQRTNIPLEVFFNNVTLAELETAFEHCDNSLNSGSCKTADKLKICKAFTNIVYPSNILKWKINEECDLDEDDDDNGTTNPGNDTNGTNGTNTTDPGNGTNTTDPTNNTTDPTNNSTDPTNNTSDPTNNTSDPTNNTSDPTNNTTDPETNTTDPDPTNNTTDPTNNTTDPTNNTTDPGNGTNTTDPGQTCELTLSDCWIAPAPSELRWRNQISYSVHVSAQCSCVVRAEVFVFLASRNYTFEATQIPSAHEGSWDWRLKAYSNHSYPANWTIPYPAIPCDRNQGNSDHYYYEMSRAWDIGLGLYWGGCTGGCVRITQTKVSPDDYAEVWYNAIYEPAVGSGDEQMWGSTDVMVLTYPPDNRYNKLGFRFKWGSWQHSPLIITESTTDRPTIGKMNADGTYSFPWIPEPQAFENELEDFSVVFTQAMFDGLMAIYNRAQK
jgi:hypothetical protein